MKKELRLGGLSSFRLYGVIVDFTVICLVVLVSLFIAARFGYIGFHIK